MDTKVFVGGGFNPGSASARVIAGIREGRFRLIWNGPTRRETEMILRRIPRLDWERVADLFRPDGEFTGPVDPEAFAAIEDPADRKFPDLTAAARAPLVTSDQPGRAQSGAAGIESLSPPAFLSRRNLRPQLAS